MHLTKDKEFYKSLILLSIPMILQNLVTFCVGLADNLMIGALGDSAVSGVYMGTQIQTVLQVISAGIEGTILLLAAQYWGMKGKEQIRKIVAIGMQFSLLTGVVFTAVCALFPRFVMGLFTNETAVIECGVEYLAPVCWSYVFFCVTQALIASMRSVENARIGLWVSLISLVVNIGLNYVLIFGKCGFPAMGVRGAAIATLIARIAETAIIVIYTRFIDKKLLLRLPMLFTLDKPLFKDFIRYGLPIVAGQAVWGTNLLAQSVILGRFDEAVITATSVANTVNNLMYVCANGLAGAVGVIIGKTIGARRTDRLKEYAVTVQWLFFGLGILTCITFMLIRDPFVALYSISAEAALQSKLFISVLQFTIIGTCYQFPCLFGLVKSGGDVGFVMKNDTIFVFGVVIPVSVGALLLGAPAWVVFLCLKLDQILKCIPAFIKIRKFDWAKNLTREEEKSPAPT